MKETSNLLEEASFVSWMSCLHGKSLLVSVSMEASSWKLLRLLCRADMGSAGVLMNTNETFAYTADYGCRLKSHSVPPPGFHVVTAASSVAHGPVGFGAFGASLQHSPDVVCSTGAAAAFLWGLSQNTNDRTIANLSAGFTESFCDIFQKADAKIKDRLAGWVDGGVLPAVERLC